MREIKIGLGIDPIGNELENANLCNLLSSKGIRATVTVAGRVGKREVSSLPYVRPFLRPEFEIANHTSTHPSRLGYLDPSEQEKEILFQHERLSELAQKSGTPFRVKGFRAPLYAYDESFLAAVKECGYTWDSSCLYSPLLGIRFQPFVKHGVVEIPVLFPDDVTLIERMLQTPDEMYQIWWKSYEISGDYFVWTIHPYGSAKDQKMLSMLDRLLDAMLQDGGKFLTLSEIAEEIAQDLSCGRTPCTAGKGK
jgi:peptidoglycan/xylan/chitin deacetylase (PgdA/CDA1 family)